MAFALGGSAPAWAQDLRGHGGPVRALAVDGDRVISGSFDTRAIVWDGVIARQITRAHAGAVTAVLPLADGRFASGGQDGHVAIWGSGAEPIRFEPLHDMPVADLAVWTGGIASGSWNGEIALWDGEQAPRYIDGHQGQITGLVAYRDGLASVGSDLRLRLWTADGSPADVIAVSAPPSDLAQFGDAIFVAGADGVLRRVVPGQPMQMLELTTRPLLTVAAGGGQVAVSDTTGAVWLIDPQTLDITAQIATGQGAIWAVALNDDGVWTGGSDGWIRRWSVTGEPLGEGAGTPPPTLTNPRGAEVFRACAVCHALTPDDEQRAGPTLHGVFGRRIGTAPGFDYSDALLSLDIIWTPQTVSELFEFGPDAYTPGSRMPEQRIPSASDRAALIQFLETATR
ncbi:c-type cytochrome [Rhodophyticola sp.]|uniref:c-type cytochrome n=1 Tax=Rhodophyticola sp. TaxID=2680032 RepID=UPI003D2E760F